MKFGDEAAEAPHVDSIAIGRAQDNFGCSVEPRLNVHEGDFVLEHAGPEVDKLDARPGLVFQQNVLRLYVRMNDTVFSQEHQGIQDLYRECADMRHLDWLEVVGLHEIVQADAQKLSHDADMLPEHNEVFNSYNIFLVVNIFFLGSHENVYLVQCQLHMLLLGLYYFNCYCFLVLVVECLHNLPKCSAA